MTERPRDFGDPRPTRREPARPEAGGRGRLARRPTIEALEGRALLSVAGGPDFSFAPGYGANTPRGFAPVAFAPSIPAQYSVTTGEAVQPDGKLIVVGQVRNSLSVSAVAVTRLDADGTVDATFGTKGVVELSDPDGDETKAVAIQADGKILVLAQTYTGPSGSLYQISLYRLNADGTVDATFGAGGVVDFAFDYQSNNHTYMVPLATTLAIQADGKILVGSGGVNSTSIGLARFDADGTPDATFGASGQALIAVDGGTLYGDSPFGGIAGLVAQADGKIDLTTTAPLANALADSEIAVVQLNADGSADTTFGAGGQVLLANALVPNAANYDTAEGLAIQPDGKLVVAGNYVSFNDAFTVNTAHFDVYRLDADGTVDATFGTMGEATPLAYTTNPQGSGALESQDRVNSVLVQPDGKILVGGEYQGKSDIGGTPTLIRLNADGSTDAHFGGGGRLQLDGSGYWKVLLPSSIVGLTLQPGGKVLVATDSGVARLLASGGTNDFNEDGISDPAVLLPNFTDPFVVYRPSGAAAGTPDLVTPFGTGGAGQTLPAPGAYDGLGVDELGVYLPALGAFGIRPYGTTGAQDRIFPIGLKGAGSSIPVPADYTGSGATEVGVYEPATGTFVYSTSLVDASHDVTAQFGTPGAGSSIPVPADYDGSGHDELAVYLPATASFAYRPAGSDGSRDTFVAFGSPGAGNSIPVPGDYDGSGHVELAVYLPAIGGFVYRPYGAAAGTPDVVEPFGMPGLGNSVPMPGDYDGSGHVELAVYLPTVDAFAYRPYGGGKDVVISFGEPGSGNTIPFTATGAESIAGGSGGGGGSAHASAVSAGWVDFVPDVAGQAKKGSGGSNLTSGQGRS